MKAGNAIWILLYTIYLTWDAVYESYDQIESLL